MSALDSVGDALLSTSVGYSTYMALKWGRTRDRPQVSWMNTALQGAAQVRDSVAETNRLRLPPCLDDSKNFDTLAALEELLSRTTPRARVLDAGAEMYSRLLPWLYLYGYRDLYGNNLVFKKTRRVGSIVYEYGDITKTRFTDGFFDAITCLSVVEHGVDLPKYFREMSRILKRGGVLITSTDYFETPTDTRGICDYGGPIRVFTKNDILEAVRAAEACGLRLTGPLDLSCNERVVRWEPHGIEYSFVVFAMTKA